MVTEALRQTLGNLANGIGCQNPGLAIERYRKTIACGSLTTDEQQEAAKFWQIVISFSVGSFYKYAFSRWQTTLEAMPNSATCEMKVTDRLIVGLGSASVLETGITFNRIYGVPFIPGSALKGLARHYFLRAIAGHNRESEIDDLHKQYFEILFGTLEAMSFITFLDAWYVPKSKDDKPLRLDVMTPHHTDYYTKKGVEASPTDFDDPIPVSFVSAVGTYLIAVTAQNQQWADFTISLLKMALADWGVGGKTSSGYGRLTEIKCVHPIPPIDQRGEEIWNKVRLVYTPGNGLLEVKTSEGKRAFAKLTDVSISDNKFAIVKKKKGIDAFSIKVKLIGGNSYQIVEVNFS